MNTNNSDVQNAIPSLSTGPQLFVGTLPYSSEAGEKSQDIYAAVLQNLKAGVRFIDTAELYTESLPHVKRAILDSKIPRNQLFITSKLKGMPCYEYEAERARVEKHLKELGIKYFDLLLVHWPGPSWLDFNEDPASFKDKMSWFYFDDNIDVTWRNMMGFKRDDLTREIGVSNFYRHHFERLLKMDSKRNEFIPPYANQIYIDATHPEYDFVQYMEEKNVHVIAYRPVVFLPVVKLAGDVGDETEGYWEEIQAVAGCESVYQTVLAWLLKRGISVIVKSQNYKHIKENIKSQEKAAGFPPDFLYDVKEMSKIVDTFLGFDPYADIFKTS